MPGGRRRVCAACPHHPLRTPCPHPFTPLPSAHPPRRCRACFRPRYFRDLLYVGLCVDQIRSFLTTFKSAPKDAPFEAAQKILGELIIFASGETANTDPMTREGLPKPQQQELLCEFRVFDLCMEMVGTKRSSHSHSHHPPRSPLRTL